MILDAFDFRWFEELMTPGISLAFTAGVLCIVVISSYLVTRKRNKSAQSAENSGLLTSTEDSVVLASVPPVSNVIDSGTVPPHGEQKP
jgi:hypothetical protein